MKVGVVQQPGDVRRDAFGPQFAEIGELPIGIAAGEQLQKVGKVAALIERGIEQHDFAAPAPPGMLQIGDDFFFGDEIQIVVAFGVVTELAFENAAADGFQQQHLLVGGVENAGQVGGGDFVQIRQRLRGGGREQFAGLLTLPHEQAGDRRRRRDRVRPCDRIAATDRKRLLSFADGSVIDGRMFAAPSRCRP